MNCETAEVVHSVLNFNEKKIPKSFHDEIAENVEIDLEGALYAYTDGYYKTVNRLLADGEDLQLIDPELAYLFEHTGDTAGTVFRHTYLDREKLMELRARSEVLAEAQFIQNRLILSTSHEPNVIAGKLSSMTRSEEIREKDLQEVGLQIEIPKGNEQYGISKYSKFPDEDEVLIEPGTLLEVGEIYEYDGLVRIELQVANKEYYDHLKDYAESKGLGEPKFNIWKNIMSLTALAPFIVDTKVGE